MATTIKGVVGGGLTISASPATVNVPTGNWGGTIGDYFNTSTLMGTNVFKVKLVVDNDTYTRYVGITLGSIHTIRAIPQHISPSDAVYRVVCDTHTKAYIQVMGRTGASCSFYISWSPEINAHTPDVTDY